MTGVISHPAQFTDRHHEDSASRALPAEGDCFNGANTSGCCHCRSNYQVEEIDDGCCGMAGAFGYEKEHYDLSMKIGEMVLFPAVRNAEADTLS
ncbi:MAG: hypothetical protein MZV63_20745 [Marinilabiliales bacterium]|nr:hypothetical protein [Marinilabiliales bacterium]